MCKQDEQTSYWCAHKTDDTLWCAGENGGNGITLANTNDVTTPIQVASNVEHFGFIQRNMGCCQN